MLVYTNNRYGNTYPDGQDNELLNKKRLKELEIAFEAGAKEWDKKRFSIAFESIFVPLCLSPSIPFLLYWASFLYEYKYLNSFERALLIVPIAGLAAIISLVVITLPFAKKTMQREQAVIYKRELELLRINIELEHQHAKSPEFEDLLKKIDQALAQLAKI